MFMNEQEIITLNLDLETYNKAKEFYKDEAKANNDNEYLFSLTKGEGVTIAIYKPNKKNECKIVFQGKNALSEARIWDQNARVTTAKKPIFMGKDRLIINRYPQIGSDEVGTGDFFGPIIVVAAYVKKEDVKDLLDLKITDSKKMNDNFILSIGPKLINQFEYSELCLDNKKYNEVHEKFNMNAIKAKMHNRCLLNLKKKHPNSYFYMDQFAEEELYFSYLKDEKEIVKNINFKTQGESSFISVALASVIARYSFLRKMKKLSDKYQMNFPFGANENVDNFALEFVNKYGLDELNKVAKLNFVNAKKLF